MATTAGHDDAAEGGGVADPDMYDVPKRTTATTTTATTAATAVSMEYEDVSGTGARHAHDTAAPGVDSDNVYDVPKSQAARATAPTPDGADGTSDGGDEMDAVYDVPKTQPGSGRLPTPGVRTAAPGSSTQQYNSPVVQRDSTCSHSGDGDGDGGGGGDEAHYKVPSAVKDARVAAMEVQMPREYATLDRSGQGAVRGGVTADAQYSTLQRGFGQTKLAATERGGDKGCADDSSQPPPLPRRVQPSSDV